MSVNAAYGQWRQFTGDAKVPAAIRTGAPSVAQQQAPVRTGPSAADSLRAFAGSVGEFFQVTAKKAKEEADPKVKAWMSQHTMAEYQQKMKEGNVPFQNDPVAMDILHNQSAYNMALQVEEAVQNQVKDGKFKTVEEAEKARISALNSARSEYVLSMGIPADSKAFNTGFDRDAEKRRAMLVGLQTDVTDKNMRTQAKIQVQADLLAPLTADFVRAAPGSVTAQYIGNTIKRAETLGQIRGDADKLEVYTSAMTALQGMPGGAAAIRELGNQEIDMFGVKATMRTHMGGGVFDQAVLKSLQTEQTQDSQRQGQLNAQLLGLQNSMDMNGLMGLRKSLEAESGGKMTGDIRAVDQTIEYVNRKIEYSNAQQAAKLERQREEDMQIFNGVQGLAKLISGDGLVSPDGKDLGFKDEAQARQGEERLLGSIQDDAQRLQVALKLASVRKDGFAANALKTWGSQAEASWGQYQQRLERGEQGVEVPAQVQRMVGLYDSNPEAFSMLYKDASYISVIEAGRSIGAPLADVAKAQAEWKKLPKDVKKAAEDALTRQVGKVTAQDPSYVEQSLRTLSGPLMSMGVAPDVAVQMARETFNKQHEQINGYPIHKGFFQVTGERESYQIGLKSFNDMLPKLKESIGNPSGSSLALWYDGTNQSVIAYNIQTGQQSAPVTRQDLQVRAQEDAAKNAEKVQKAINKVVAKQDYNRRVEKARSDAGIFPGNRLKGDSGFSGAPK